MIAKTTAYPTIKEIMALLTAFCASVLGYPTKTIPATEPSILRSGSYAT